MTSEDSHASWYAAGPAGNSAMTAARAIFEGCSPAGKHPVMPDSPDIGLPALVPDGLGRFRRGARVQVPAARRDRPERVVELVHQRDAGRDVQLGDGGVADPVQVLDQR